MSSPSLASLVAAVRATPSLASWSADLADADVAEIVRTARTTKGAVWLATRAAGPQDDPAKQDGQEQTALAYLRKLSAAGHPLAAAALFAWGVAETEQAAALADDLAAEIAAQ